jgi:hypothetical protein
VGWRESSGSTQKSHPRVYHQSEADTGQDLDRTGASDLVDGQDGHHSIRTRSVLNTRAHTEDINKDKDKGQGTRLQTAQVPQQPVHQQIRSKTQPIPNPQQPPDPRRTSTTGCWQFDCLGSMRLRSSLVPTFNPLAKQLILQELARQLHTIREKYPSRYLYRIYRHATHVSVCNI